MPTTREKRTFRTYYNTTSADELYIAGCFGILLDYRSVDQIGRPTFTHTHTHTHVYTSEISTNVFVFTIGKHVDETVHLVFGFVI